MRNKILMLSAAAATVVAMATPASAHSHYYSKRHAPLVAGAVVGTVVGIGIHQAWWGSSLGGAAALPATVGGAVAGGFIVGVGTAALIHAATTPCTGFHGLFGGWTSSQGCVNGQWVGTNGRRVVRARY